MLYPVFLQLKGKKVLIAGAGPVGVRKARTLAGAGAKVTVVSPTSVLLPEDLRRVRWVRRNYRTADLKGAALVFACTNDRTANRRIVMEARRARIPVQNAADPKAGDFQVPSSIARGQIQVAFSTGGASPALARVLRERAERLIPEGFERYIAVLERIRRWQTSRGEDPDKNATAFRALVRGPLERAVLTRDRKAALAAIRLILGAKAPAAHFLKNLL